MRNPSLLLLSQHVTTHLLSLVLALVVRTCNPLREPAAVSRPSSAFHPPRIRPVFAKSVFQRERDCPCPRCPAVLEKVIGGNRIRGDLAVRVPHMCASQTLTTADVNTDMIRDVKTGKWRSALKRFEDMLKMSLQPDVQSFTAAMTATVNGNMTEFTLGLFDTMQKLNIKRTPSVYSVAISACEKGRQWERALELLSEMPAGGVENVLSSYNSVISACQRSEKWERALSVFAWLDDAGLDPNIRGLNAALASCDKGGQWEYALKIFEHVPRLGLQPDLISFQKLMSSCSKGGQWRVVLRIFEQMQDEGWTPDADCYKSALSALQQQGGRAVDMIQIFEEMRLKDLRFDVDHCNLVLLAQKERGEYKPALSLLQEMTSLKVEPNLVTIWSVIQTAHTPSVTDRGDPVPDVLLPSQDVGFNVRGPCYEQMIVRNYFPEEIVPEPTDKKEHQRRFQFKKKQLRKKLKMKLPKVMDPDYH